MLSYRRSQVLFFDKIKSKLFGRTFQVVSEKVEKVGRVNLLQNSEIISLDISPSPLLMVQVLIINS